MPGEGLDSGMLERKPLCPDRADQFDRANAVRPLRENQVTTRRALPRLDVAQNRGRRPSLRLTDPLRSGSQGDATHHIASRPLAMNSQLIRAEPMIMVTEAIATSGTLPLVAKK